MDRASAPLVPLHLTSLAILSPSNAPLYVHSFTSPQDSLRHYHLSHAAVDVIEERIVMTSTPNKPADSYLGLLFCMEDMAFYGFQTPTKLRMVLSVALVDALIKDADIVAIFRAIHYLVLQTASNPFVSLPASFAARPDTGGTVNPTSKPDTNVDIDIAEPPPSDNDTGTGQETDIHNAAVPTSRMFASGPEDIRPEWFRDSQRFQRSIAGIGSLLNGVRL